MRPESAAVFAAVTADPQGIGFVDAADLSPEKAGVKFVSVGTEGRAVAPEPRFIGDGTYPLAKPLLLYVSSSASDAAKDFAKFAASGSEAVAAVLRRHGFVPLPPHD